MEHQTPSGFPGNFRKRKVLGTLWFPSGLPETLAQAKGTHTDSKPTYTEKMAKKEADSAAPGTREVCCRRASCSRSPAFPYPLSPYTPHSPPAIPPIILWLAMAHPFSIHSHSFIPLASPPRPVRPVRVVGVENDRKEDESEKTSLTFEYLQRLNMYLVRGHGRWIGVSRR